LFGNVAPGGVINLVTRKPDFQTAGEIGMRMGSYGFYKPFIDLRGVISKYAAYRINTTYENAQSFRDNVRSERFYINPSLLIRPMKKLEILLEGDYLTDDRTNDYGVGAINYALIDIPRSRYLGTSWAYNKTAQKSVTSTITYTLNKQWSLRNITAYQDYFNDLFGNTRPNASSQFVKPNGDWIRGIQRTAKNEKYWLTEFDITGKFNTGSVKHEFLAGVDADKYNTSTVAYRPINVYDTLNVFDLNKYKSRNDVPDLALNTTTRNPLNRAGVYVQDLVSLTAKLKVLAGVRFTYMETFSNVLTHATKAVTQTKLFDHAITPRAGLVYQPVRTLSLFASYANSFVLNTGTDVNGKALEPSYINQYEAGIKNDLLHGLFSVNATAYWIVNSNLAQISLADGNTNTTIKELAGEVTSKGVELDITSKPYHGISIIAGYSYNDTRYTRSNTYIVGSRLLYNPANTANASVYYTFDHVKKLKGLNIGATVFYVGKRAAGRLTRVQVANDSYKPFPIPEYTMTDLSIGYTMNKVSMRVRLTNVFNVLSYNVHDDNSVNPLAPRQVAATFSMKL
jgi:iron complex outermembrane receptor protein